MTDVQLENAKKIMLRDVERLFEKIENNKKILSMNLVGDELRDLEAQLLKTIGRMG